MRITEHSERHCVYYKAGNIKVTSLLVPRQYPLVLLVKYAVGNVERWEDKKVRLWGVGSWSFVIGGLNYDHSLTALGKHNPFGRTEVNIGKSA
jgi:hypothetical protein